MVGEWLTSEPQLQRYEVYEKKHAIVPAYWGGYVRYNVLHRKVLNRQGVIIDDEYVTENQAILMYEPLLTHNL